MERVEILRERLRKFHDGGYMSLTDAENLLKDIYEECILTPVNTPRITQTHDIGGWGVALTAPESVDEFGIVDLMMKVNCVSKVPNPVHTEIALHIGL
jgi:hypothetical protein